MKSQSTVILYTFLHCNHKSELSSTCDLIGQVQISIYIFSIQLYTMNVYLSKSSISVYIYISLSTLIYIWIPTYVSPGQSKWKQEQFTIKNVTQIFFFNLGN